MIDPYTTLNIRTNSYIKNVSLFNSNQIIKYHRLIFILFPVVKIKVKKIIIDTNAKFIQYLIFFGKYLNLILCNRIFIIHIKSDKEVQFSINNKEKLGVECIIGINYFFRKKKFVYLVINPYACLMLWSFIYNKIREICCSYRKSVLMSNIYLCFENYLIKKNFNQTKNKFKINFNYYSKKKSQKIYWLKKKYIKKRIQICINVYKNQLFFKGYLGKKKLLYFNYYTNLQNIKLENSLIMFSVKKKLNLCCFNLPVKNFLYLEETYLHVLFDIYSTLENIINWRSNPVLRISTEEQKIENFIINIENCISIKYDYSLIFPEFIPKSTKIELLNCEFLVFTKSKFKKKITKKWKLSSLFLDKKFRKYFFSEINTIYNSFEKKKLTINNSTFKKNILIENNNGQIKTIEFNSFFKSQQYLKAEKNRLWNKNFSNLVIGKPSYYINL